MKPDARAFPSHVWITEYDVHDVHGDCRVACRSDIHNARVLIVANNPKNLEVKTYSV